MSPRRTTSETAHAVARYTNQGKTKPEISRLLNISVESISYYRTYARHTLGMVVIPKNRLPAVRREWTTAEVDTLIRLRDSGESFPTIARKLKRSYPSVRNAYYQNKK